MKDVMLIYDHHLQQITVVRVSETDMTIKVDMSYNTWTIKGIAES